MVDFKAGDKVRVVGSPDGNHKKWDDSDGFDNLWVDSMNGFVGKELEVESISSTGISLTFGNYSYSFPPQALELISDSTEKSQPKEQTYTEEQIRQAWNYHYCLGDGFNIDDMIEHLKKSTDPDYELYLKLKEKFDAQ